MTPTEEQLDIFHTAASSLDNFQIVAYAGTGKTSTLEMLQDYLPQKPILYLCFNRDVAKKAEKRMASTTTVRTFNSIGHRIWAKSINRNLTLAPKKVADMLRTFIGECPKPEQTILWSLFWEIVNGVQTAKSLGYVPEGKYPTAKRLITRKDFHRELEEDPDELVASCIDEILFRNIAAAYAGNIDYNDQVYMPALFSSIVPKFPFVKVDEAQDLNPVNHALLDKLAKQRFGCVGDPYQSIYGFRGAVQSGMASLAQRFKTVNHTLSVSFRCPQEIVENARWRVPDFKWIKPGGYVATLTELRASEIEEGAAILCRNNAPLFLCAMRLIMAGRSVSVAGSDLGPKLIGLMKRLGDATMPKDEVLSAIESWREQKLSRNATAQTNDLADCMRVFAEHGANLSQAIAYAEHIFKSQGTIRLLTGHKAKGLEFPIVYHLDPWLISDDEQDLNLRYVIQTRSLDEYYEIDSDRIRWD